MISQFVRDAVARRARLLVACLVLVCGTQLIGAGKSPMRVLKYDPAAEKMDLFAAMDAGAVTVRVVAHDSTGGNAYFENLSGKPLTVNLPDAVAMVQVLKQGFFQQQGNNNQSGNTGFSNLFGGQQQGGGQSGGAQSLGSSFGFGQQGTNGNNGNNGQVVGNNLNPLGNNFFSIPPDRIAQVPFRSVCLNYGKPDPSPRMTYKVVPLETYTEDKVLQESLKLLSRGRIDREVVQAAAWHRTDKLSWNDLAGIKKYTLPGVYSSQVPIFSIRQLKEAQELVAQATKQVEQQPTAEPKAETPAVQTVKAGRKL